MVTHLFPLNISLKAIIHLIDTELALLESSKNPKLFGLVDGSESKIDALLKIKAAFNNTYHSKDEIKQDFIMAYQSHYDVLHRPRNKVDLFFRPSHTTNNQKMAEKICKILNIHPDELNPSVQPKP